MRANLFILLEPCFSPRAWLSRLSQASLHKERFCASVLFNHFASMSFYSTTFHPLVTFFFFFLNLYKLFCFHLSFLSSIFFTYPNHRNLCSLKNFHLSSLLFHHKLFHYFCHLLIFFHISFLAFSFQLCVTSIPFIIFFQGPALGTTTHGTSHTTRHNATFFKKLLKR